ncbi:MAG: FHA domain-containing protein, partial [Clostridiales bacterium]|nr:FHA domain-containing protein [Clostridiales bacterium]
MHLFLYCPNGMMLSLYLPNIFGGRYKFDSSSINEELPYYVEARDNQWVLYCGDETEFCEADNTSGGWRPIGKAFPLENRAFRYLKYHGKIYTVYSELDSSGNNALIPYYFETNSIEYSIGRNTDNLIVYPQLYVSRHHASLLWDGNNWIIEDKKSTNGVYVNGRRVTQKSLCIGDVIYIMGLSIVVGNHYFSINNAGKRISINSPYIHRIASLDKTDIDFSKPSIQHNDDRAFDRPPRKLIKVEPKPIEIEMP